MNENMYKIIGHLMIEISSNDFFHKNKLEYQKYPLSMELKI